MRILILSFSDVATDYTATLLQRGHSVVQHGGGMIHAHAVKDYIECDGALLLGDEPQLREIADYMEASGKPVWRQLTDIPKAKAPPKRGLD